MKKYIRLLPVMLFPYAYLFVIFLIYIFSITLANDFAGIFLTVMCAAVAAAVISAVYCSVCAAREDITAYQAAKLNLAVKAVQIPAYVFHFLLGAAGTVMSVWGIGLIMFAVAIDVMTIVLTGIHAVGCVVKIKRENVISGGYAVLAGICSFLFCIDMAAAVILFIKARKQR